MYSIWVKNRLQTKFGVKMGLKLTQIRSKIDKFGLEIYLDIHKATQNRPQTGQKGSKISLLWHLNQKLSQIPTKNFLKPLLFFLLMKILTAQSRDFSQFGQFCCLVNDHRRQTIGAKFGPFHLKNSLLVTIC